ncbi:MAG: hypothetical protein HY660_10520 [Armatimonadetes bacterium]|nr:hypothetical protein [Armatimonadota bacterium]
MTVEELKEILGPVSPRDALSTRSPRVKELGLDRRLPSNDELLRLMVREPTLIRRPIIHVGGQVVIGFDRAHLERLLGGG